MVTAGSSPSSKPVVYHEFRILLISCLTSIATIIGSGILALPVSLHHTSIHVFLQVFTLSLLAQIGVIYAIVELMQRSRQKYRSRKFENIESQETPQPNLIDTTVQEATSPPHSPTASVANSNTEQQQQQQQQHDVTEKTPLQQQPLSDEPSPSTVSLFSIAQLYLNSPVLRSLYYVVVFLSFISMLVSYGLAGPQAVWQLFHPGVTTAPPRYMAIAYWALGSGGVIFFLDVLLGVFGSFTVLKGALFVCVVFIVAMLPEAARPYSLASLFADRSSTWLSAGRPFLISCVALGGLPNTMPVTFNLLPVNATRAQLSRYRLSNIIAVVLCYLLNIGWVLAVLQVVPRTAPDGQPSLYQAYYHGEISTVPLIAALNNGSQVEGTVLLAIEVIIEMFILISTGVSFFVIAAGLKSFVDGTVEGITSALNFRRVSYWAIIILSYVISFGSIIVIVVSNPDGFVAVLTFMSSLAFNIQGGVLVMWMLRNCMMKSEEEPEITLPIGKRFSRGWFYFCFPFFAFASLLAIVMPLFGEVKTVIGE